MSKTRAIVKNSIFLYFRMLVVLGTSLYTVRVVLHALGVGDFGIYGLAGGMVTLFAFLNATMNRTAQRFLGVEIGKGNVDELNKTFNAILVANAVIALFVVLISLSLGLWLLNYKLTIPPQRLAAANIVFCYSVATTVALILRTPYSALIISRQKMWFFSATSIIEALLKLGAAFLVSHTHLDHLKLYALIMCLVSWFLFFWYMAFCRTKFGESKIAFHRDRSLYRELLAFTGWSFIGNFAHVVRTQGVNMLLNVFFGTSLNAAYGVMSQAQGATTQFTSSFSLALSPHIYKSYGERDLKGLQSLVFMGAKLNFMLLALLAAPAIYSMDFVLKLWLGAPLDYAAAFINWMLLVQLLETASQPLMDAALATGKIKRYQIVVGGTILLNLPLSWLAFKFGGSPTSFLYIAFGIQLATFALRVWFMKIMIQLNISAFFRAAVIPLLLIASISVASIGLTNKMFPDPQTFIEVAKGDFMIVFFLSLACFFFGFNNREKHLLLEKIRSRKKRPRG